MLFAESMKTVTGVLALFLLVVLFAGCRMQNRYEGNNLMTKAENIAIFELEGFDEVVIFNTKGDEVAHYALVDRNAAEKPDIPEDAVEIKVPLKSVVVDSEVYASAFEDLGKEDAIRGIFDAQYVTSEPLKARIASGKIAKLGQTSSANLERILALAPDAIMISYFDGMNSQDLDKLGIPVIKMYDLQESTPLGRAEWIKLFGKLTGSGAAADSIFEATSTSYNRLASLGDSLIFRPKVLTQIMYNGVWSVAGPNSYQARMIGDGGGDYFEKDARDRTLNLTPEGAIAAGGDADIWIIPYYGSAEELLSILNSDPLYSQIKAFKTGNVYFSDTSKSGLYREFPFHPDRLLKDYLTIFSADTTQPLTFYKKLQ